MATVTMDIAELDKLRQELKEQKEKQEALSKEMNDVKSDKRVIVKTKPATKADFTYSFDMQRYTKYHQQLTSRLGYSSHTVFSENDAIRECLTIYPLHNIEGQFKEFINFEDAKEELKAKLEEKYKDELANLRASEKYSDDRLRDKQKEFEEAKRVLIQQHEEREALKQKDIDALQKKYDELESGKRELSKIQKLQETIQKLQETIQKLEKELIKEKSKSWWQKLLGK